MKWIISWLKKFSEYFSRLWLFIAFLLVAGLSFEAGLLQESLRENEPLIITSSNTLLPAAVPEKLKVESTPVSKSVETPLGQTGEACAFVGSKNSNKYHIPTTRCAKQIKSENRVCFASIEAAKARGYIAGCLE